MAPGQSNSVFVGNIPFNLSEEQIIAILSQAGQVVKFRLMTHPETGKPKGYGFADYADADSAASAVRNLNDFEVNGRKIRVDLPHNNEKDSVPTNYEQPATTTFGGDGAQGVSSGLPPLPPGTDLPPNLKTTDAISQTLNAIPPQQLLEVLQQMKGLAVSDPARATELLKSAPQLSYAIFQALILMNLVDAKVLAQVVEQAQPQQQQPINIPPPQPTPQPYAAYQNPIITQQQRPPPPQQQTYAPPPPMQQQQQQPQQAAQMSQEELLRQVLAMDQRTIDSLPPAERAQIIQLRQQLGVR